VAAGSGRSGASRSPMAGDPLVGHRHQGSGASVFTQVRGHAPVLRRADHPQTELRIRQNSRPGLSAAITLRIMAPGPDHRPRTEIGGDSPGEHGGGLREPARTMAELVAT
jgi:hypothetical protein